MTVCQSRNKSTSHTLKKSPEDTPHSMPGACLYATPNSLNQHTASEIIGLILGCTMSQQRRLMDQKVKHSPTDIAMQVCTRSVTIQVDTTHNEATKVEICLWDTYSMTCNMRILFCMVAVAASTNLRLILA